MHQSSVKNFFKSSKRTRESGSKGNTKKLIAVSSSSTISHSSSIISVPHINSPRPQLTEKPSPLSALSDSSSPEVDKSPQQNLLAKNDERKFVKGKRAVFPIDKIEEQSFSREKTPERQIIQVVQSSTSSKNASSIPPLKLGSPAKISSEEINARANYGPPRLTPIKKLQLNSPSKSPSKSYTLPIISPEKFFSPVKNYPENIFRDSPSKITTPSSPLKPAPSFTAKPSVKRLFGLDTPAAEPAYKRYRHLVERVPGEDPDPTEIVEEINEKEPDSISSPSIKNSDDDQKFSSTLPIPYKYSMVCEVFRCVETVCSILFNRSEIITFRKLKSSVVELLRSEELKEKHLAQILTVFPTAYEVRYEKVRDFVTKKETYQLVITPNIKSVSSNSSTTSMSGAVITERRRIFLNNIIGICYKHHEAFLAKYNTKVPEGKKVNRWHPKFPLDSVPEIPCAPLPLRPDELTKQASAKEILSRAQNIIDASNPRMKVALQELFKTEKGTSSSPPVHNDTKERQILSGEKRAETKAALARAHAALLLKADSNPKMREALNKILLKNKKPLIPEPKEKEVKGKEESGSGKNVEGSDKSSRKIEESKKVSYSALKGVSQALIDKIKAREKEKSIRSMTLTPEENLRRSMLSRLPNLVKILQNTMIAERKPSLPLRTVVDRLTHSQFRTMTDSEVEKHLRLLQTIVPEWLFMIKSTMGEFVKIDKEMDVNGILSQLEEMIELAK